MSQSKLVTSETGVKQRYPSSTKKETIDWKLIIFIFVGWSQVNFYLSKGFKPTDNPMPELYELEPEDIHMAKVFERKQ